MIVSPTRPSSQQNWMLFLLALGLVLTAWIIMAVGEQKVSLLDLSRWGTDLDVWEQIAIDKYIARHFQPYIRATITLDALAFASLGWAARRGRLGAFGVLVGMVLLLSSGWHGWNWLLTSTFAMEGVRF